ncbi:MAG: ShlB/FhaC/HecB family hemolysin secretion/activation protein [Verrucomicrobiia bacterium]
MLTVVGDICPRGTLNVVPRSGRSRGASLRFAPDRALETFRSLHGFRGSRFAGLALFFVLGAGLTATGQGSVFAAGPNDAETSLADESAVAEPDTIKDEDDGQQRLYIKQFRIKGSTVLDRETVERTVYPFLGPERTLNDIEAARLALEEVHRAKGFQTVTVNLPQQRAARGIITFEVVEAPIGRLNVVGSRFFHVERIRRGAPSLREGVVPNFNDVQKDLIALNQWPDRQITPNIRPGHEPDTFDVDLEVKDTFPLHGSVELNNRYTANTTELRFDAALRYDNLWQKGHTLGAAYQVAPENPADSEVLTGFYIWRFQDFSPFNVMLQGTIQNSDVATLGGGASVGEGSIIGGRLLFNLPTSTGFFQTASLGLDYKDLKQDLVLEGEKIASPIRYWPITASYTAVLFGDSYETEIDGAVTFAVRGAGSTVEEFDDRRFESDGSFLYFRGSLAHTQKLPYDMEFYAEVQGQASNVPLVDSEQFTVGGLTTVRGYLEAAAVGDNAIVGSVELRTPSLFGWMKEGWKEVNEWRWFVFIDGGIAKLKEPLPEQIAEYRLWSYGFGTTIRLFNYLNGSLAVGVPMIGIDQNEKNDPFVSFRLWAEL